MLRKLLIASGVLLGILVLAIAALLLFVDVNQFKPQIEQAASSALQRQMSIHGDLKLSLLPRLAVQLPKTTLSERNAQRTFAEFAEARVGVALLPLLRGQIHVARVEIDGLRATVERRKDGSSNIDDLLGKDVAGKTPAGKKANSGSTRSFRIDGVELRDARITVLNPDDDVLQLSALRLETGPLAPQTRTDIALKTHFSSRSQGPSGDIALSTKIDIDLPEGQFVAWDLKLESTGELQPQKPYAVALSTPRLAFGSKIQGDKLQLQVKLGGVQSLDARADIAGIEGDARQMSAQSVNLAANASLDGRKIGARLATPMRFSADAKTLQLPKLTGSVDIDDPALPVRALKMAIDGHVNVEVVRSRVAGTIAAKFDATTMTAKFDVAGSNPTRVQFDVQADHLNIDRYLPAEAKPTSSAAAPAPKKAQTQTQAKAPTASPPDNKIDLSVLRGLTVNGQLRVESLQAHGLKLAGLRVAAKAVNGRLDLAPLSAQLYSGTLSGNAFAAADGNRLGVNVALSNIDLDPLLRDAVDRSLLAGRGTVRIDVTATGQSVAALQRGLQGTAGLALRDGAIKGINIAQHLRTARALVKGDLSTAADSGKADATQQTDFSELNASFTINNGVATNSDLDAKSPLLRLGGAGRIDIPAESLDYTLRVSVVGTLKGQDGRDLTALRGVTVPVRLHGAMQDLSYTINWGDVAQDALKERALEELQKRLGGSSKEGDRKNLEDAARDVLKGLFRR